MTLTIAVPTLTDMLAWIGALTGVAALFWQITTWRRSTHRVKVKAASSWFSHPDKGGHHIRVTAINTGAGPVTVEDWGFTDGNGNLIAVHPHPQSAALPHRLEAGSSSNFYMNLAGMREQASAHRMQFKRLRPWVRLGTGQRVQGRRRLPAQV